MECLKYVPFLMGKLAAGCPTPAGRKVAVLSGPADAVFLLYA